MALSFPPLHSVILLLHCCITSITIISESCLNTIVKDKTKGAAVSASDSSEAVEMEG